MIDDLGTYEVANLLLFSEEVYRSLLGRYNQAIWPAQIAALGAWAALLYCARRPGPWSGRLASAILAALWIWVGAVFHQTHFQTINWAAKYFAWLFYCEAALMATIGGLAGRLRFGERSLVGGRIGGALFIYSIIVYPVLALSMGQSWGELTLFGWGADQTAIGTLGLVLLARRSLGSVLLLAPAFIWCVVAALMSYGLRGWRSPDLYLVLAPAGAAALAAMARLRRER